MKTKIYIPPKLLNTSKYRQQIVMLLCVVIVICALATPKPVYCATTTLAEVSEELNNSVVKELDEIDFSSFNGLVEEFEQNSSNIFTIKSVKSKVYSIITGENAVNYSSMFTSVLALIGGSALKYMPLLAIIVAIGVVGNLLSGFKSKFNEKSSSSLIQLVCFMAVSVLVVTMIKTLVSTSTAAVQNMSKQMNATFPILLTLMIGLGATASVSTFQPVVSIMSTYIADFFSFFIVPMFTLSFVFSIISNLTDTVKLDKFNSFISGFFKWSVGLIFTIFFAVFTLQGITAGKFDSLGIRTTKFTIKSSVPVMGGYLSDGMDIILSSTMLIKNAVGFVGVLLCLSTIISPIIQIALLSLMLKLVAAILQAMGEAKTSSFLTGVSKSITMLSTAIIAVGFMYLLSVGLIMTTANVVVWWKDMC